MQRFALLLWLLFLSGVLPAQEPVHQRISAADGLPSNSVYDVFQDQKGYIWMATDEGLCRYDGKSFRLFTHPDQSSRSGSNIQEDRFGRIWYQNFDGYLYYVANNKLQPLPIKRPVGYAKFGIEGNFLYFFEGQPVQCVVFDLQQMKMVKRHSLGQKFYINSGITPFGFTFHQEGGVKYLDAKAGFMMKSIPIDPYKFGFSLIADPSKLLYITEDAQDKTVHHYRSHEKEKTWTIPASVFIQNSSVNGNELWLLTPKGCYLHKLNSVEHTEPQHFFADYSISDVLRDRENNLWISSTDQGVLFVPDLEQRSLFPDLQIRKLASTGHSVLFGTRINDILEWHPGSDPHGKNISQRLNRKSKLDFSFLEYDAISHNILFGAPVGGILNEQGKVLEQIIALKDAMRIDEGVYAIAGTGVSGLMTLGGTKLPEGYKALGRHQLADGSIFHWLVNDIRGKSVAYDPTNKRVFFATNDGLKCFGNQFSAEWKKAGNKVYGRVLDWFDQRLFVLNAAGELWASTDGSSWENLGKGLLKKYLSPEANFKFMRPTDEGLLLITNESALILSKTTGGQYRIQRILIQADEIYDALLFQRQLLLASNHGLLIVNTENKGNAVSPRFDIHALLVDGNEMEYKKSFQLEAGSSQLEIRYALLHFKPGNSLPLYYRINQGKWLKTEAQERKLILSELAAGNYVLDFRLGALNQKAIAHAQLTFYLPAPWYLSWVALIVYCLLVLFLFYALYQWRIRILKRRNAQQERKIMLEKQLSESALKSIRAQMNPHFFFNALNTIQSYIYANDKSNASNYLSKFSKLTRIILEMSEKESVSLEEEISALRLYLELEQRRFNGDFDFQIECDTLIRPDWIRIPSLFLQPYVENAIKHGLLHREGPKHLLIQFAPASAHELLIRIEDNGIGRAAAEVINSNKNKPRAFATSANQKRIDILNENHARSIRIEYLDKTDAAGLASGTCVMIYIPV